MIHGDHSNSCEEYSTYQEIFFRMIDGLNLLRGFFMFLIFVCKKTVWSKVVRVMRGKKEVERELTETQIFTTSAWSCCKTLCKVVISVSLCLMSIFVEGCIKVYSEPGSFISTIRSKIVSLLYRQMYFRLSFCRIFILNLIKMKLLGYNFKKQIARWAWYFPFSKTELFW